VLGLSHLQRFVVRVLHVLQRLLVLLVQILQVRFVLVLDLLQRRLVVLLFFDAGFVNLVLQVFNDGLHLLGL